MYYLFINNKLVYENEGLTEIIINPGTIGAIVYGKHLHDGKWFKYGYFFDPNKPFSVNAVQKPNWFELLESDVPPECKAMILLLP